MAGSADRYECPYCQLKVDQEYTILLHIEVLHTDDSPFVVRDENGDKDLSTIPLNRLSSEFEVPDEEETGYVLCTEDGCEEIIPLMDLQTHLDFHIAEQISMEDVRSQTPGSGDESADSSKSLVLSEKGKSRYDYHGRSEGSSSSHEKRDNKAPLASKGRDRYGRSIYYVHEPASSPALSSSALVSTAGHSGHGGSPKKSHRAGFGSVFPAKDTKRRDREKERLVERLAERPFERPFNRTAPTRAAPIKYESGIPGVKRLGVSDLGPYAHEAQMPQWLRRELELGGKLTWEKRLDPETGMVQKVALVSNETPDLIPVIALLCERDANVARAWVCHPGVKHVGKQIKGEGGFCGYRNIQMVISYVQHAFPEGSHPFERKIPTILKLQDWIEEGWDKGINSNARLETGGIKGTRKYIGTSEAQTMFISLGIPCRPFTFTRSEGHQTQYRLLDFVERYFQSGSVPLPGMPPSKVLCTQKPPIYLQHSGHSMTIVGCETTIDGSRNLLVFDPFFAPSAPMKKLSGRRSLKKGIDCELLLRAYRRGMGYLQKYKEFEVIALEV